MEPENTPREEEIIFQTSIFRFYMITIYKHILVNVAYQQESSQMAEQNPFAWPFLSEFRSSIPVTVTNVPRKNTASQVP